MFCYYAIFYHFYCRVFENIDLFGGDSLDIFKDPSKLRDSPQLKTWQKLHQRELKLAITHPPQNYFQEMILWTEQGKIWQFPINNEFGRKTNYYI